MSYVYDYGINDMPRGWISKNEWNKKVYKKWVYMLMRVYSESFHEKRPTYINTTLQLEWHWLSYFVKDFKNIEGYDEESFLKNELELDKDIKSNGINKEYSIDNCCLVTSSKNSIQATKTRNNDYLKNNKHRKNKNLTESSKEKLKNSIQIKKDKGEYVPPNLGNKHSLEAIDKIKISRKGRTPNIKTVIQYDKDGNFIAEYRSQKDASINTGCSKTCISECCRGEKEFIKDKNGNLFKFVSKKI